MSTIDELLRNNEAYVQGFDLGGLPIPPAKKLAVVTCMDARVRPHVLLALHEGDAHVIHHTDCGMLTFTDDDFRRQIQEETGIKPPWPAEAFADLEEDVRQSVARIVTNPFIPKKDSVRGFVYEVETGRLREVK